MLAMGYTCSNIFKMIHTCYSEDTNQYYDAFVVNLFGTPILRATTIHMSGGDPFEVEKNIAIGDNKEELLMYADLQGISLRQDQVTKT